MSSIILGRGEIYTSITPVDENWLKGVIEFTQKTLDAAVKEVPPSQVLDFSFAAKAAR
ncbi:MAG TPA: hypothetical protein VGW77_04140 [Candidatus Binatia bacterium]|nr:hypothetical protein [Candidatus Binatia bacterium]